MQELDDSEQALIALARRGLTPSADDAERVLARIERTLGTTAGARDDLARAHAGPGSAAAHWAWRAVLALSIAGASGFVGYRLGLGQGREFARARTTIQASRAIAPTVGVRTDSKAVTSVPQSTAEPLALTPAKSAHARARRPTPVPQLEARASIASASDSLQREIDALREAERALRDGEPGAALERLDALDRELPDGRLLEERRAAASVARCTLGLGDRRMLRESFLRAYPDSMYRERVEQGCAAR